jgi:kynurenine formamidase
MKVAITQCMTAAWIGVILFVLPVACMSNHPRQFVDLTYPFDDRTVYWPNNPSFHWEKTDWGTTASGYWYAAAKFSTGEHGGTHMDAPIHFAQGRRTIDEIPIDRLTGPAVVIDARAQCERNVDYELSVQDLLNWESRYGRIPDGALVFMWSGWGQRWPDRVRYLGTPTPDDAQRLHFPGLSLQLAEFLIHQRMIRGVGIDTASIDPGRSQDFQAHRILNGADVYILENVASLDRLPPQGAMVMALPMKIKGGTGSPVRIVAWLP